MRQAIATIDLLRDSWAAVGQGLSIPRHDAPTPCRAGAWAAAFIRAVVLRMARDILLACEGTASCHAPQLEIAVKNIEFCAAIHFDNSLADIQEDEWFQQPAAGITHLAWQVGHLAMARIRLDDAATAWQGACGSGNDQQRFLSTLYERHVPHGRSPRVSARRGNPPGLSRRSSTGVGGTGHLSAIRIWTSLCPNPTRSWTRSSVRSSSVRLTKCCTPAKSVCYVACWASRPCVSAPP